MNGMGIRGGLSGSIGAWIAGFSTRIFLVPWESGKRVRPQQKFCYRAGDEPGH